MYSPTMFEVLKRSETTQGDIVQMSGQWFIRLEDEYFLILDGEQPGGVVPVGNGVCLRLKGATSKDIVVHFEGLTDATAHDVETRSSLAFTPEGLVLLASSGNEKRAVGFDGSYVDSKVAIPVDAWSASVSVPAYERLVLF